MKRRRMYMDYQDNDYQQQAPKEPPKELSTGMRAGLIIGTIFINLLGIILGIVWMTDQNASYEKRKFGKTLLILGIVIVILQCLCGFIYIGMFAGLESY